MSEKKNLLFSKRETVDKSTSMGQETQTNQGLLGNPQNNQDSTNKKKKKKTNKQNVEDDTDNENQIERASNGYLKSTSSNKLANLKNENIKLSSDLETLASDMEKERENFIKELGQKEKEFAEKNSEMKKISMKYLKNLETLKKYEKNLVVKTKDNPKSKVKSEEEIKNEIKLIEKQIKKYEERANIYKQDYEKSKITTEKEEKKEQELEGILSKLNEEIEPLEREVNKLKNILLIHQNCKTNSDKLIEEYNSLNKSYQYEIKRAKNLALLEIKEGLDYDEEQKKDDKENNNKGKNRLKNIQEKRKKEKNNNNKMKDNKNQEDEKDTKENAKKDMDNFLPKIKNLKFNDLSPSAQLEKKIIKKNKIGINNSPSNKIAIGLFKKLNEEYNDNERYIKEANKNIRIENMRKNLKTEENPLFNDFENKMMQKVLSPDIYKSCQDKLNNIIKEKKDIKKKFEESYELKNNNLKIINDKDFNKLRLKEMERKKVVLEKKCRVLVSKVNDMKKNIKDVKKMIKREEEKIKKKDNERKRIEIYYKKLNENVNNNNSNKNNNKNSNYSKNNNDSSNNSNNNEDDEENEEEKEQNED